MPDCGRAQKEDRELAKLQEQERIRSGKELAAAKRIEEQQQACPLAVSGPNMCSITPDPGLSVHQPKVGLGFRV